jgi:hypothetical protein
MFYDGVEKITLHQEINGHREMWIPATNRIKSKKWKCTFTINLLFDIHV